MPGEQRALLGLLTLGLVGQLLRLVAGAGPSPGDVQVLGGSVSSGTPAVIARRDSLARLAGPLRPGDQVDIDAAPARELVRLPGVGPALAQRIVAERERGGPFGGAAALERVRGFGPALLEAVVPFAAFSGIATQVAEDTLRPRRPSRSRSGRVGKSGGAQPGLPRPAPSVVAPGGPPGILSGPVADVLNQGTAAQLDRLPGIGRVRAQRIVAFRDSAGAFRSPEDLARVPGISLALARRLWTAAGQ